MLSSAHLDKQDLIRDDTMLYLGEILSTKPRVLFTKSQVFG